MKGRFLDIAAFVLSFIAFGFSIYTYNRHQHQLLEDKQIDAVVGLVEYIQERKLGILFTPEPIERDKKEFQIYTFFELADTTIRSDMNQAPIYFPSTEKLPFDFTPYINNPLIPSEIAIKLRDYYLLDVQHQGSYDAVYSLMGYMKRYISKGPDGSDQSNYIENEWRYVVTGEGIDWKWSLEEYMAWRGKGDKPEPSDALKAQKLTFNVEDITHIIVKTENEVHHFVDAILAMKNIGGLDVMLAEDDRKLLLTKIISQEKIEKDF